MAGPIDWLNEDEGAAGPEPELPVPPLAGAGEKPEAPASAALTVEEARALLLRLHGVAVPEGDPLLMIVTLFARVLQDYEALLARHDKDMAAAIGTSATAAAKAVDESLETLKDKTVRAGINGTLALVERQGVAVEKTMVAIRKVRTSIAVLTVLTWLASGVSVTLLWSILK
ncbi:hypothetical protein [Insolitispirillum peregrinum]|uniref:hypothetical protein n=1 Tax=Insolitispirillum peregrinum TaxID=80876 RepID=UPI00360D3A2D